MGIRIRTNMWNGVLFYVRCVIVLASLSTGIAEAQTHTFVDVAERMGIGFVNVSGDAEKEYILEVNGNGAAFFDYDSDGDLDLLFVNGSTIDALESGGHPMTALYRNDGDAFVDVTAEAGLTGKGWGMGACVADVDNDGHSDLYVTAYTGNVLYRNLGDGRFENITDSSGVGDESWSSNCAFADFDLDGDVDLYVANYVQFSMAEIPRRGEADVCRYMGMDVFCGPRGLTGAPDRLYRNDGGVFVDVSESAGLSSSGANGFGVVFSDLDGDGWPDIYVANDMMPNFLYRNDRDGSFSEIGLLAGVAVSGDGREQAGMGLDVADYDGDGLLDIVVTNFSRDTNTIYRNQGDFFFSDTTAASGIGRTSLQHLGWGVGLVDLDNDGWRDLFVANGHVYPEIDSLDTGRTYRQSKELYRNVEGSFVEIPPGGSNVFDPGDLVNAGSSRGTAFGDYDNDGDVDIVVVNMNAPPNLFRNDGPDSSRWVSFRLEGTESNRDAIGARVEIDVGERTMIDEVQSGGSYLSHNDLRLHFGLGVAERIDDVRVRWPTGMTESFGPMSTNAVVVLREGEGESSR